MRTRLSGFLTIGAFALVIGFAVIALGIYGFRPTPGVTFLILGWMSMLATGYFLVRAVSSFDLAQGAPPEELTATRRAELDREKKLLLKAIKEAEFDRDTGKMDSGLAAEAIGRYRGRAMEIIQLLEQMPEKLYDGLIERELARRLAAAAPVVAGEETDEEHRCAACGVVNDEDAAFCKKCGLKLGGAAS